MILSIASIPDELLHMINQKTHEEITVCDYNTNKEEALKLIPEAEILITWGAPVNNGLFNEIDDFNFKWLFSLSVGVDKMPFDRLIAKGTTVSNIKGVLNSNIAEQVLGVMISFSRNLKKSLINQKNKYWQKPLEVNELIGKTLCIIGTGSIGSDIAKRAKAFDMNIVGIDLFPREVPNFDKVYPMDSLHHVLSTADYCITMTPLTKETYHLIGEKEFNAMKDSCIFMNFSRGDVVDEKSLISALKNNKIAGAGLDVFHTEPLNEENPLWDMENVIITPHCAGDSPLVLERAMKLFADSLILYRNGQQIPNIVDLNRGY